MFDLRSLLTLFSVPGVGPNRFRALIGRFGSPEEVLRAPMSQLMSVEGIDRKIAENIKLKRDNKFVENQLALLSKTRTRVITFWDEEYPANLRKIYDPPALLFLRGKLVEADNYSVAIVGTRSPSNYGRLVTERISGELAKRGITVVSGMARGIDTVAHWGTLKMGGRTVAVLGSGVDIIYPSENRKLAQEIESKGCLISEFPMGTQPDAGNFPRRNRIISGMTLGTLVVEAGDKSGALITAEMALEQNREVFAIPGNINSAKSKGTNRLIQEGAKLVQSVEDILSELEPKLKGYLKPEPREEIKIELTPQERRILENLSERPMHIDKIAQSAGVPTSQALSILLSLELKDMVKQLAGKMFVRTCEI